MVDVGAQLQICSATEQLRILLSRNTEQSLVTSISMQVNQLASWGWLTPRLTRYVVSIKRPRYLMAALIKVEAICARVMYVH